MPEVRTVHEERLPRYSRTSKEAPGGNGFPTLDTKNSVNQNGKGVKSSGDSFNQIVGTLGALNAYRQGDPDPLAGRQLAEKMVTEGKPVEQVRLATGWGRGADGKWRYEVPDLKFKDGTIKPLQERNDDFEVSVSEGLEVRLHPSKPCMTFNVKIEKLRKLSSQARRLQKISRFFRSCGIMHVRSYFEALW